MVRPRSAGTYSSLKFVVFKFTSKRIGSIHSGQDQTGNNFAMSPGFNDSVMRPWMKWVDSTMRTLFDFPFKMLVLTPRAPKANVKLLALLKGSLPTRHQPTSQPPDLMKIR